MYHLVKPGTTSVFVDVFHNKSVQPSIEIALHKNLKKTFAEKPGFILAAGPAGADIVLSGAVVDLTRAPGFFSGSGKSPVTGEYQLRAELTVTRGTETFTRAFNETFRQELTTSPKTDALLDGITEKLALDIYFLLVRRYGN
jgi:hypothetical protein